MEGSSHFGAGMEPAQAPHALTRAQTHRPFRPRYIMGAGALRTAAPKLFWPTRAEGVGDRGRQSFFARVPLPRI